MTIRETVEGGVVCFFLWEFSVDFFDTHSAALVISGNEFCAQNRTIHDEIESVLHIQTVFRQVFRKNHFFSHSIMYA
jgi:hypothetical protein